MTFCSLIKDIAACSMPKSYLLIKNSSQNIFETNCIVYSNLIESDHV